MKTYLLVLSASLVLTGCLSVGSGYSEPPVAAHVLVSVPRTGQVSLFFGDLRVDYNAELSATLDFDKSPAIRVLTTEFTVSYDKSDPSRVNLLGQTDRYRAVWKGTVQGSPFQIECRFQSPDYSQKATKGPATLTKVLGLQVSGESLDGTEFQIGTPVSLPAVLATFRSSGDTVSVRDVPGLLPLGGLAVQYDPVGCLLWGSQRFVLTKTTGETVTWKDGRIAEGGTLGGLETREIAAVETARGLLQALFE